MDSFINIIKNTTVHTPKLPLIWRATPSNLDRRNGHQGETLGTNRESEADHRLHHPNTNGHMSMKRNAEEERATVDFSVP